MPRESRTIGLDRRLRRRATAAITREVYSFYSSRDRSGGQAQWSLVKPVWSGRRGRCVLCCPCPVACTQHQRSTTVVVSFHAFAYESIGRLLVQVPWPLIQIPSTCAVKISVYIHGHFVANFPYIDGTGSEYTFVSVNRRNNDARGHTSCNVGLRFN